MMRLSCLAQPSTILWRCRGSKIRAEGPRPGHGFRFFAERTAGAEGIHGWVANREDGAVEVFAEGEADALMRFERRLRQAADRARRGRVDRRRRALGACNGFFDSFVMMGISEHQGPQRTCVTFQILPETRHPLLRRDDAAQGPRRFPAGGRRHGAAPPQPRASTWWSASRAADSSSARRSPIGLEPASRPCASPEASVEDEACILRARVRHRHPRDSRRRRRRGQQVLIVDDCSATGGPPGDRLPRAGGDVVWCVFGFELLVRDASLVGEPVNAVLQY